MGVEWELVMRERERKDYFLAFNISRWLVVPFTEMRFGRKYDRGNQGFYFGHVKFEMASSHSKGRCQIDKI